MITPLEELFEKAIKESCDNNMGETKKENDMRGRSQIKSRAKTKTYLNELMKIKSINENELSIKTGIHRRIISDYVSRRKTPSLADVIKISEVFGSYFG